MSSNNESGGAREKTKSTGMKRKVDAPDEDSSDEKESKRARLEDSKDVSDTASSKEPEPVSYVTGISNGHNLSGKDHSLNGRVEIAVEYNDTNSQQNEMQDEMEKSDKDDSEKEDNESKHSVKTDSTESEVSETTTIEIYSRCTSSDSSVNETTVTGSVVVSEKEEDTDNKNRSNTEEEQETQKDEFVYRLLNFYESYTDGLRPKNIRSYTSLQKHVEDGSKSEVQSRFISCCKTMSALKWLGGFTNKSHRERPVVRINISKLDRDNVKVIDLTDVNIRRQHISPSSRAWGYAENFDEVILAPTSHVPKECVEKIGKIHHQSFVKDKNIELD